MIISITGPSGVGKTTLLKGILRKLPDTKALESVTTRAPRPSDEAGYVYVSDAEFDAMSAQDEFIWEVHPHGKRYATRKAFVEKALASESLYAGVLVIDAVQKLHALTRERAGASLLTPLYVRIEDEAELRRRFAERNDMNIEEIENRIIECRSWNIEAAHSGVPFIYLDGMQSREALLAQALSHIKS